MAMNSDRAKELAPAEPGRQEQNLFRVQEHVRATHGSDGATVLDILHGQMFRLNFVGSRILELLKHGSTEAEIAEKLAHEFGIDRSTAEADVREFIEILEKHHLLTGRADNSPLELEKHYAHNSERSGRDASRHSPQGRKSRSPCGF
jgi:hypothetical protein